MLRPKCASSLSLLCPCQQKDKTSRCVWFKIQDYFITSSEKFKRAWTLTTSQYTIAHIVYVKTQLLKIQKLHNKQTSNLHTHTHIHTHTHTHTHTHCSDVWMDLSVQKCYWLRALRTVPADKILRFINILLLLLLLLLSSSLLLLLLLCCCCCCYLRGNRDRYYHYLPFHINVRLSLSRPDITALADWA